MLRLSATCCPLLFYTAFVLFAAGHASWAYLPGVIGVALYFAFPIYRFHGGKSESAESERDVLAKVRFVSQLLIILWVTSLPEVQNLIDRLFEGALWNLRLLSAVGIWTAVAIYSGLKLVNSLSDEMIVRYYGDPGQEAMPQSRSST